MKLSSATPIIVFVLVVVCILVLAACNSLSAITAVVDATELALPVLESAGVQIPPQIITYVGDVANCIGGQTGNPTPAQILAISSCLASQVAPTLTGLPGEIARVIVGVIQAVQKFIQQTPPAPGPNSPKLLKMSKPFDAVTAMRIEDLRGRARTVARRAGAIRAKGPGKD